MPYGIPKDPTRRRGELNDERRRTIRYVWWYDSIIDIMLANPGIKIKDIAKKIGKHANWVGLIMSSDTFKLHWAHRRQNLNLDINDTLAQEITGRVSNVAIKTLDLVLDAIDENPLAINPVVAMDMADKMLNRLGYGPKVANPGTQVSVSGNANVAVVTASPEAFERARARVRELEAARRPALTLVPNAEEGSLEDAAPVPA